MNEQHDAVVPLFESARMNEKQKTFICFGTSRGGTSAVAGILNRLGVHLGDDLPNTYEDPDFVMRGAPHMRRSVATRNKTHDVWGWKNPDAARNLENLLSDIRNPHLVVVFRDMVATMKGHVRWHDRTHLRSIHEIILQQQMNWFLIERLQVPTAMVSYEKAMIYPENFIHSLARFVDPQGDRSIDVEPMIEFLTPGSYKDVP